MSKLIRYEQASDESVEQIRLNECESQLGSLATNRFRTLWNAYADATEKCQQAEDGMRRLRCGLCNKPVATISLTIRPFAARCLECMP